MRASAMSQGLNPCQGVSHKGCVAGLRCDGADTQHLVPAFSPHAPHETLSFQLRYSPS